MAAPNLYLRPLVAVQVEGTDDAGYNLVGHPYSRASIAQALADLADLTRYPAASSTFFHQLSIGAGTFTTPAFALPPWTFLSGTCDGEGQPNTVILLTGDVTLSAAWVANAMARGGFSNITFRVGSGNPIIDLTMPVPTAGNPVRIVEIANVKHNLALFYFEATGTADAFAIDNFTQDGTSGQAFTQLGGTSIIRGMNSACPLSIRDKTGLPAAGLWQGIITGAGAGITANSIAAVGTSLRLLASAPRTLTVAETAPGVIAVAADVASVPIRSAVTYTGSAAATDLTLLNDAAGLAYTPTTPGNWTPVPANVQAALDTLAASGGGSSVFSSLTINGAAGTVRPLNYQTATVQRWRAIADATAEGGANAGSNYQILRFADNGTLLGTAMDLNRATGKMTYSGDISMGLPSVASSFAISCLSTTGQNNGFFRFDDGTTPKAQFRLGVTATGAGFLNLDLNLGGSVTNVLNIGGGANVFATGVFAVLFTQTASASNVGSFVVGTGATPAICVSIGGGNIWAGGTITAGTGNTVLTSADGHILSLATAAQSTLATAAQAVVFGNVAKEIDCAITVDTTFTSSGYTLGYEATLFLTATGGPWNLTFPGWVWVGGAPTAIASGKRMMISLSCRGAAVGNVFAVYSVEA